jgi:uncharacterized protein (TIGR03435 family)
MFRLLVRMRKSAIRADGGNFYRLRSFLGDLRRLIGSINTEGVAYELYLRRAILLGAAALVVLGGPIGFILDNAPRIRAQTKEGIASPATFEGASVRISERRASGADGTKTENGKTRGPVFQLVHRRLVVTNFNLFGLIVKAYGVTRCRPLGGGNCPSVAGGPGWLRRQGFDVAAKIPDDSPDYTLAQLENGRAPQLQMMLQRLLAERFHLKVHRERRDLPIFALTVAKNGPTFKAARGSEPSLVAFRPKTQASGMEAIQLVVRNGSMQELADLYSKFMDGPVVDRTGLAGRYDFTVEYEADPDAPGPFSAATGPSLFRALQEQAGLGPMSKSCSEFSTKVIRSSAWARPPSPTGCGQGRAVEGRSYLPPGDGPAPNPPREG